MHKNIFLVLLLALFAACSGQSNKKVGEVELSSSVDSLYKLVVAKHDEVMPKIKDIENLKQSLRDDLENMGTDEADKAKREEVLDMLSALQNGYDAMFGWMNDFKNPHLQADFYKKSSEKELLTYLKEEETKIDRVAKIMLESIGNAELFLKK